MTEPLTQLDSYRLLGNSSLRVSPLCLGTMTFGLDGWGADFDTSREILETYANEGGNFIDTADQYAGGTSESFLGKLLVGVRDRFVLATKYSLNTDPTNPNAGGNHRRNLVRSVEASLKRLDTDYIDLYWLHLWDYRSQIEDVMRALDDLVRQGKILHIGFSDTPAWVISEGQAIAKLRGWTPISAIQLQYNLAERSSEANLIPMAQHHNMTPMAWSPLAGGVLTGKYSQDDLEENGEEDSEGDGKNEADSGRKAMAKAMQQLTRKNIEIADVVEAVGKEIGRPASQVAINWVLQQPGDPIAIVGSRKLSHLKDNLQALAFTLTSEQIKRLNDASSFPLPFPYNFASPQVVKAVIDGKVNVSMRHPAAQD